jgi:hypothetical protein
VKNKTSDIKRRLDHINLKGLEDIKVYIEELMAFKRKWGNLTKEEVEKLLNLTLEGKVKEIQMNKEGIFKGIIDDTLVLKILNKTYKKKSLDNNKFNDEENNNLNQKTGFINLSEDKDNLLSLNNVCKHLNRGISIYN